MSTGTYGATSINLSDRVTLNAISNDNLDLEGNAGADVNITGISDLSTTGAFEVNGTNSATKFTVKDNGGTTKFEVDTTNDEYNSGTNVLGGHVMIYYGEKSASASSGAWYSWGNGSNASTFGPRMPVAGKIRYVTLSTAASSTCTVAVGINGVASAATVSLSAATSNTATVNVAFAAGDRLGATVTSGTAVTASVVSFAVIFT